MHCKKDTGKVQLNLSDVFFKLQIWFIYKGFPLKYPPFCTLTIQLRPARHVVISTATKSVVWKIHCCIFVAVVVGCAVLLTD